MRIFDVALKDLSQVFRDKRSLLFLVAMPIVFTLFMGFAYRSGSSNEGSTDQRISLGWVNNDPQGLLSGQLFDLLSNSEAVRLVELTSDTVMAAVQQGEVAGALVIPAGFSEQAAANPANSQTDPITLLADTSTAQGQSLYQLVQTPILQVMSSLEIASLSAEAVGKANDPAEMDQAFTVAVEAWKQASKATPVRVEMVVAQPQTAWYGDNPYNQASPGILVQFAIFGMVTSGQILVQERKTRTLQRMMTTSLRPWEIIAGHTLAMFSMVFAQVALMVIFGQFILGVNYLQAPLSILLLSAALGLWIAAMGLLIGVMVKNDSQVILFSLMAMFIFSAMGGTWFPLEATSGAFTVIGRLTPSGLAMTGYQNILIRGQGLSSTWAPVLGILAYAAAFFGLAVWRFRRMEI
jgi:ABC-2 type transport system permease protein